MRSIWLYFLLVIIIVHPAVADQKVALVIGAEEYQHFQSLNNPVNDASAVADTLTSLGFEVAVSINPSTQELRSSVQSFSQKAQNAEVSLIYYAGHAFQIDGLNYLVASDAEIYSVSDLEFEAIPFDSILRSINRTDGAKIIILDACRNNPFTARENVDGRLLQPKGLAKIDSVANTYIAFATEPDGVALDGEGMNSPFTEAFVGELRSKDGDLQSIMRRVRRSVVTSTNQQQTPWDQSSLTSDLFIQNGKLITTKPTDFRLTGGKGPDLHGIKLGHDLSALRVIHGDNLQFFQEYELGTEYMLIIERDNDGLPKEMLSIFIGDDDLVQSIVRVSKSNSILALQNKLEPFLSAIGENVANLEMKGTEFNPSYKSGHLLLKCLVGKAGKGTRCIDRYFYEGDEDIIDPDFFVGATLTVLDENASMTETLEAPNLDKGEFLFDVNRDKDIEMLHFAKIAISKQSPYSKFHGVYAQAGCEPIGIGISTSVAMETDRLNRMGVWFSPNGKKISIRVFVQELGVYETYTAKKTRSKKTKLDGRPAQLTRFRLTSEESGEKFDLVFSEQEQYIKWNDVDLPDTSALGAPMGGTTLIVAQDDQALGGYKKCSHEVLFEHDGQRVQGLKKK